MKDNKNNNNESFLIKALISGNVCALVASILNPLDVIKIRIQNNSNLYKWNEKSMLKGLYQIYKNEGIKGWLRGINASILRELFYSSIRIGAYEPILKLLTYNHSHIDNHNDNHSHSHNDNLTISPFIKFLSGLLSGGIGSALANPTDLVKVNFQAHIPGISPPLPYYSTWEAFIYFYKNYGLKGLYKGWMVTSTRSALLTSAQMGSYDTIKNNILRKEFNIHDGYQLHFIASMLSGIITTTVANPGNFYLFILIYLTMNIYIFLVDVIKTRYMSDHIGRYSNPIHCFYQTYLDGGISIFFKVTFQIL